MFIRNIFPHPTRFLRLAALLALLWSIHPFALALDPAGGLDSYRHDLWSELEGAPRLIDALAQTADGWLWIGSRQSGLLRFDGVRFHPYVSADGSELQGFTISVLRPAPDGTLWIGYGRGGLTMLRGGKYTHLLTPQQTGSVYAIAIGADQAAWVATDRGLFRVVGARVERIDATLGYGGAAAEYVLADGAGRIWAADGLTLYRREANERNFRAVRQAGVNPTLLEARDGSVWLLLGKRFERVAPPAARVVPAPPGRSSSFQSAFDRDGNAWSGNCPVGLCVVRPADWRNADRFTPVGAAERFDQPWQMTSLSVLSMMEDGDGSLWIGTHAGLERLRDGAVHMVSGTFDRGQVPVALHPDGSLHALQIRKLDDTSSLARVVDSRLQPLPNRIHATALDTAPDGTLVLAGQQGIERHTPHGVERIALPPLPPAQAAAVRITKVKAGTSELWLWLSAGRAQVWHYRDGRWDALLPGGQPREIAMDGAGVTYFGYSGNRLRIVNGGAAREYGPADGIDIGIFNYIAPGAPLLISGDKQMQILKNGHFHTVKSEVPGGLGPVSGFAIGPGGERWLNAEKGILRVTAPDWTRTMQDPRVPLRGTLFDAADGYPGGAAHGRLTNTALAAPDGRLWFTGERGLAWVDPHNVTGNAATPDVAVLSLSANGRRHAVRGPVALPEGTRDVQIDYTTPSLRMPGRVTFRYRLAGTDAWEDAGARRTAFFQHLSPGDHAFEVMAANENGVPSRVTTLRFRIAPRLTQTARFNVLCILAALLAVALAYRLRTRQLAARVEDRLLVRVRERESIARALHDTFLQSLQGTVLSMHAAIVRLPPDSQVRTDLERVLTRAEAVLAEGRDEVKGLRGAVATAAEFHEALLRDIGLTHPDGEARLHLDAPHGVGQLRPRLYHDVFAIAREAVTNALRHTAGPVTLHVDGDARAFSLAVADQGAGLGDYADGKPGHFGLAGMRERAALIGGRLQFDSSPAGTRVVLVIPAAQAYAPADAARDRGEPG